MSYQPGGDVVAIDHGSLDGLVNMVVSQHQTKGHWLGIGRCPRCVARARIPVKLASSALLASCTARLSVSLVPTLMCEWDPRCAVLGRESRSNPPLVVHYVGEVAGAAKQELFANAAAPLLSVRWLESFGTLMVEALAGGAPVISSLAVHP